MNALRSERASRTTGVGVADPHEAQFTLSANHSHAVCTLVFDPNQITCKDNRANPKWGDESPTLSTKQPPVVISIE